MTTWQKTEQSWEQVTDDFRIANLRREPAVTLMVVDGAYLEFTVSYVVDYLKRTVTKDQLFTRILDEVSTNESKVRWVSSPGPATPHPAPAPASQEGLAPSSSVAGACRALAGPESPNADPPHITKLVPTGWQLWL